MAGQVIVGEQRQTKAGERVADNVAVRIKTAKRHFVSRAGDKLLGALKTLEISVSGLDCVDLGASTGGFVDCLLHSGAARVCAVDVGYGLLADKVRRDPRVIVMERCNARHLQADMLPFFAELVTVDVSFIGATALLAAIGRIASPHGRLLVMIKPQFELHRDEVGDGGVVVDDALRTAAVDRFTEAASALAWHEIGRCDSEVAGPKGNREVFVLLARRAQP